MSLAQPEKEEDRTLVHLYDWTIFRSSALDDWTIDRDDPRCNQVRDRITNVAVCYVNETAVIRPIDFTTAAAGAIASARPVQLS